MKKYILTSVVKRSEPIYDTFDSYKEFYDKNEALNTANKLINFYENCPVYKNSKCTLKVEEVEVTDTTLSFFKEAINEKQEVKTTIKRRGRDRKD